MSYKIAMIGAGSVVFSKNLTGDFLRHPEFADATFTYMDVDRQRLEVGAALCGKVARALNVSPKIEMTMDRREAVKDADFVICMVQIGGFNSTLVDFEIPRKYGLNFTIADTTGPGGVFRALRTFPLMRDLARDIADLAKPDCWFLNYSNPMSMNMLTIARTTGDARTGENGINAVGLCHSVQGTFANRMRDIGVDPAEASFEVAGINHMAFFRRLVGPGGEDLYPRLFEIADERIAAQKDAVRYELLKRLGYAVTESSEHNAEYSAFFMPHAGSVGRYKVPIDEYLRRCDGIVDEFDRLIEFSKNDEPIEVKTSHEYGAVIGHSVASGAPSVVYGNMLNLGAIPNLPATAIVETPTLADANGCRLTRVAPLEPQLLGYVMPHVVQHECFIEGVLAGRRDRIYQACMNDPLTAATVPPDKIVEMCDELIAAHGFEADGGVLPPLSHKSLVPGSGKTFDPPTPQALRASWDEARKHTSDEDVVAAWHVVGPFDLAEGEQAPPEADYLAGTLDTDAAYATANNGSRRWVGVEVEDEVQPGRALGTGAAKPVFGHAVYESVHDRETTLRVRTGRGSPITVWLNGKQIHRGPNESKVAVHLREGHNPILIRQEKPAPFSVYVTKANF